MSPDMKCSFCGASVELASYVDHVIRDCDSLSVVEKNRVQEAVDKLLCECRACDSYVYVKGYEKHRKERDPHTTEPWHAIEPELSCYCPFAPRTAISGDMRFSEYRHHALKECPVYINFILAHCQTPKDWPKAEIERLKYWLRLLETRRQSRPIREETESDNSGSSIWITFVQGGLCNGR